MNYTNTVHNPWLPPQGGFNGILHDVKFDPDQPDWVRFIYSLPRQAGLDNDYLAGKTYGSNQHQYLAEDLRRWLGRKRLEALAQDGHVPFAVLPSLIGECAQIEIELVDKGYPDAFRAIRSIRPCGSVVRLGPPPVIVPRQPGFSLNWLKAA